MNNKFKTILTVVLALIVSACIMGFVGCKSKKDEDNKKTQTSKNTVVSIYDAQMNFVDKFSYDNHDGNTINVESFKKVGYKFEGVYDAASGVMLFNANGVQSPIVMLDKDYTAVLKYSPITYQLVFEAGEGKLENTAEYIKNATYGEVIGLFPATFYEGKELDGWYDENDKRYSFGTSPVNTKFTETGFSLEKETIKLYARYSDKYYTVSLLYQDGSIDVKLKVKHGDKMPDLSEYLKDNGSRAVVGFGVSATATEVFDQAVYTDLELYAMWRDYKNVYFCYGEDDTRVVKVYRSGSTSLLPDGEKEGYVFEGWYQSELLTGNKITSVSFSSLAATYYARWSLAHYTISFVADGKLISSSAFDIKEQDIFVPPVPAKDHYSGAWEDYELQYKNMTVNAVYTPDEITLSLMANGDYNYKKVVYGESYSLSVPRKKGYDFDGWFYKDQKVTDANGNSLAPYTFDGSVTLTAKFVSTKVMLFFESNGGTTIDSVSVDYGTPYTLTQTPEREGFYFGGWFDETLVNEYIGTVTLTKNAIVYAKWIKSTEVYDLDDLKAIADNPYGNYHLTANINLRGEVWEPIEKFSGILNGNGYKIYNFALKKDNADLGFIIKNQGTIKNLNLSNIEVASTVEGAYTCSISAFCAYNEGSLVNVAIESVNALVNVKNSSVNNTVIFGPLVGESSGKIISCTVKSSLTLNTNLHGHYNSYSTDINVGGLCGKNSGAISTVKSTWNITINEYVSASSGGSSVTWREGWKYAFLNVGSICGAECGNLTNAIVNFKCYLYSNAGGTTPCRIRT